MPKYYDDIKALHIESYSAMQFTFVIPSTITTLEYPCFCYPTVHPIYRIFVHQKQVQAEPGSTIKQTHYFT